MDGRRPGCAPPILLIWQVLGGLFGVVSDLFGVSIKQIDPETIGAQIWHESVRLFEVRSLLSWCYFFRYR